MKRRCGDPKFKDFPKYGGLGIGVCDRWANSFIHFLADMGERPSRDHSIDRLNPSKGYEPNNCRWATSMQQLTEHKRDLAPVVIAGVHYPNRAAACAAFGVRPTTVSERLKRGIDLITAITTPTRGLVNKRPRESYLPRVSR